MDLCGERMGEGTMNSKEDFREKFKDHRVDILCNNKFVQYFECRHKSGTSNYAFRVVISDNMIAMTGDIGELMVCPGYGRKMSWFRGISWKYPDYFVSKIPYEYKDSYLEFDYEKAIESVKSDMEMYKDCEETTKRYKELLTKVEWEGDELTAEKYYTAFFEVGFDDPGEIKTVKTTFWYKYSALRWLAEQLDVMDFEVGETQSNNQPEGGGCQACLLGIMVETCADCDSTELMPGRLYCERCFVYKKTS